MQVLLLPQDVKKGRFFDFSAFQRHKVLLLLQIKNKALILQLKASSPKDYLTLSSQFVDKSSCTFLHPNICTPTWIPLSAANVKALVEMNSKGNKKGLS